MNGFRLEKNIDLFGYLVKIVRSSDGGWATFDKSGHSTDHLICLNIVRSKGQLPRHE